MYILGVRIDTLNRQAALQKVRDFLFSEGQKMVFTPNPEMVVDAQKDTYFREILNKGDLNICDGKGIELLSKEKIERIAGVDFMPDVCRLAEQEGKSVYLLGSGFDDVVKLCREKLLEKLPRLKIVGVHPGPKITVGKEYRNSIDREENDALLENIILTAPDILFVAFGHGKQEKWMYEFLPELPSVKVAMGVGGTFDFIAKKVRRAPKFIRSLGLEWFWRLFREPRRIKRIWKATVVFLFLYFKNK